jgi:hypothetical protein
MADEATDSILYHPALIGPANNIACSRRRAGFGRAAADARRWADKPSRRS